MEHSRRNCLAALAFAPTLALANKPSPQVRRQKLSAAARGLFTAATAPDAVSRMVLGSPVRRLTDGMVRGSDPAALMHGRFAQVVEQNFACASSLRAARWVDTVEVRSLHALAQAYLNAAEHRGRPNLALDILAHRLDPARLARLAEFFGHARVHASVLRAAPGKVDAFNLRAASHHLGPALGVMHLRLHESAASRVEGPNYFGMLDYTIEEIYLSFRTAPIGATSVSASMFQTGLVVGGALYAAWNAGFTIGSYLAQGAQVYAPSFWDSLVDGVGAWVEALNSSMPPEGSFISPEEQQGQLQRGGFGEVFQLEPSMYDDFAINEGDFGSTFEWANYLPYEPYGEGPVCTLIEHCTGPVHPNRAHGSAHK